MSHALASRSRRAPRRLQLPDSHPGRRAGLHPRRRASAALRAASRCVVLARPRRYDPRRLRPYALDAAAQSSWAPTSAACPTPRLTNIPSFDNSTGKAAQYCGPLANQTVRQLCRPALLADARLSFRQLDAGGTVGGRQLYQHRHLLGARVSRRLGHQDHAVLPARLQRDRADRAGHRLQLPDRLAGLRRRRLLQSGHSKSHRRRGALHQASRDGALDADRRHLHQPVRQRTARGVLTTGGFSAR